MATSEPKQTRPWHDQWLQVLSGTGEKHKVWCQKLAKVPGTVRCKVCKKTIKYITKGLSALTNHANTKMHIDNSRLFKQKAKASSGNRRPATTIKKAVKVKPVAAAKNSSAVKAKAKRLKEKQVAKKKAGPVAKKRFVSLSKKTSSLPPKYTLPILSRKFLHCKPRVGQKCGQLSRAGHLPSKKQCVPSGLARKTPAVDISPQLVLQKLSASTAKLSNLLLSSFHKKVTPQSPLLTPSRKSPVPAVTLSASNKQLSLPSCNQVYSGSDLKAAKPPVLCQREPWVKLIPVFMCYFCHAEFPSRSSLYKHRPQCTVNTSSTLTDSDSIQTNSSMPSGVDNTAKKDTQFTNLGTSSSSASATSALFPLPRGSRSDSPSTPIKPRPAKALFVDDTPNPSLSPAKCHMSKSSLLTSLGLLPTTTALQHQRRISRKRRNTECESLDWVEDEVLPKTPCTPPTTKLLISHLSREDHKQQDSPHRAQRLSSSSDFLRRESVTNTEIRDGSSQAKQSEDAGDLDSVKDASQVQDVKISVARSLYNVDVTSPLGQFVIKHYRTDPSLHILSDIESHCLTSKSSVSARATNCCLRVRPHTYPVVFGESGRRPRYHDFYHTYKFNRKQVREFMTTVNTGLNRESRQLLRQMKKCQVRLRRISKADLCHWVSNPSHVRVDVTPLSVAEIAYWTTPKPTPSEDNVSVFPEGLKLSSPYVKAVLGLQSKKEVRIKSFDEFSSSILNIAHFVSEETCADLLSHRKTVYRCLLSDSLKSDCENMVSPSSNSNSLLRRLLSKRPGQGDLHCSHKLPDITNLDVHMSQRIPTLGKGIELIQHLTPCVALETRPDVEVAVSSLVQSPAKQPTRVISDISCASFVEPKVSDLPRGEIPSPPDMPGLPECDKKVSGGAGKGVSRPSVHIDSPSDILDILSVEEHPHLMRSFRNHFQCLRDIPNVSLLDICKKNSPRKTQSDSCRKTGEHFEENEVGACIKRGVTIGEVDRSRDENHSGAADSCGNDESRRTSRGERRSSSCKVRRKSSPRITTRVKVNLSRRLSAAGLVKRDQPLYPATPNTPPATSLEPSPGSGLGDVASQDHPLVWPNIATRDKEEACFPSRRRVAPLRISLSKKNIICNNRSGENTNWMRKSKCGLDKGRVLRSVS